MIFRSLLLCLLLLVSSCYRVPDKISPRIDCEIQDRHFAQLHSAFKPLNHAERISDWGKEMIIAEAFAKDFDLYRAISTFKRAEILIPSYDNERKLEVQYDILLCYFLAKRYEEAVCAFEKGSLAHVDKSFPAYRDLLLVLYECYREMDNEEKQERVLELMEKTYPGTSQNLKISTAIRLGDIDTVQCYANNCTNRPYLQELLDKYQAEKKSVATAQTLNAFLPGAGYLYLGQQASAFTAFFLNGLFIVAAYEFFHHGHTAAGIITSVFESGWYFGGIYGAGLEAKYYNERVYERNASYTLNEAKLFPVLMLQYGF